MANFATHINVAAMTSGISAILLNYANIIDKDNTFIYFVAGTIGGILPDIDHDKAIPLKIMQFFFANLFALIMTYKFVEIYPILNLIMIWILSYLAVVGFFKLFKKFTIHRGIIHSIPCAFLCFFTITSFSFYILNLPLKESYFIGFFIFLGYLTHLILDEIFSIDISGMKLKKSFGSALKFYSNFPKTDLIVYIALIVSVWILPYKSYFLELIKEITNV
jgi:membrane-bound metal-dependent hydrolase YbcI (DUF457 family)